MHPLTPSKSSEAIQTLLRISKNHEDYINDSIEKTAKHFNGEKIEASHDNFVEFDGPEAAVGASIWTTTFILKALKNASNDVLEDKGDEVKDKICKSLLAIGLPKIYSEKLVSLCLKLHKNSQEFNAVPRYDSCQWKLDVGISPSTILKLLEPSIEMNFTTRQRENQEKTTEKFAMTAEQFGALRFKVAEALKTLYELEKSKALA